MDIALFASFSGKAMLKTDKRKRYLIIIQDIRYFSFFYIWSLFKPLFPALLFHREVFISHTAFLKICMPRSNLPFLKCYNTNKTMQSTLQFSTQSQYMTNYVHTLRSNNVLSYKFKSQTQISQSKVHYIILCQCVVQANTKTGFHFRKP